MQRNSLGFCWHSQMHNMIQKLIVRRWYQSLFSCCRWVLNINHKLCVLRLILCSHSDLRVNVLFFHLYLRTDESVLRLAPLSTPTKSIFHAHSVLAISCSPSEVTSALEDSTPSILFVFILASVQPTKVGSEICLIDISFFSTARKLSIQKGHCEVSRYAGVQSLMSSLCSPCMLRSIHTCVGVSF